MKKRKVLPTLLILTAVLLLLAGTAVIHHSVENYVNSTFDYADHHLLALAQMADRSIDQSLYWYEMALADVVKRRGFQQSADIWLNTGDDTAMLTRMTDSLILDNRQVAVMVAFRNGEAKVSTDGRLDYRLAPDDDAPFAVCNRSDGKIYMAVLHEAGEVSYAALLDLPAWYTTLMEGMGNVLDHMMLVDDNNSILVHEGIHGPQVEHLDVEAMHSMSGLSEIADSIQKGEITYCNYPNDTGEKTDQFNRLVAIPVTASSNGLFTVAVAVHGDRVIRPLRQFTVSFGVGYVLALIGVVMLVAMVILFVRRHRTVQEEIALLQSKKEEMEQLVVVTRELAHHQRLTMMGTLASGIAHEFNNLLTPIMGYSLMSLEKVP